MAAAHSGCVAAVACGPAPVTAGSGSRMLDSEGHSQGTHSSEASQRSRAHGTVPAWVTGG